MSDKKEEKGRGTGGGEGGRKKEGWEENLEMNIIFCLNKRKLRSRENALPKAAES